MYIHKKCDTMYLFITNRFGNVMFILQSYDCWKRGSRFRKIIICILAVLEKNGIQQARQFLLVESGIQFNKFMQQSSVT